MVLMCPKSRWTVLLMALALCVPAPAVPSEPTLDELLNIQPGGTDRAEAKRPTDRPPAGEVDPLIKRRLRGVEVAGSFQEVIELMDVASDRLGLKSDAGLQTQRVQEQVLAKLDKVIAEAERQQRGSSGDGRPARPEDGDQGSASNTPQDHGGMAGGNEPNRGLSSPGRVGGVDPNRTPLRQLRREWGHLPPHLRAELLQGIGEKFSPVYQSLTEAYFRRLAEEGR